MATKLDHLDSPASQRFCPHCNASIGLNARFCGKCGKSVPAPFAAAPSPRPQPAPAVTPQPVLRPTLSPHHGACPRCGAENPFSGLACLNCGSRLPWASAPLAPNAPPDPAMLSRLVAGAPPVPVAPSAPMPAMTPPRPAVSAPKVGLPIYYRAPLVGALGGLLAFFLGELAHQGAATDPVNPGDVIAAVVTLIQQAGVWSALCSMGIGSVILAYDNLQSLRGRWNRDLIWALPLFAILGGLGGMAGQFIYLFDHSSLMRGVGWALIGGAMGLGMGLLRRDQTQAQRGAMGGAIGAFIGGLIFNSLTQISEAGNGALSRAVGLVITGAMIALLMRVVQEALKDAYLVGLSEGPYRGKEYPLNLERVTVGRSELNHIALYRESELTMQTGAFVRENGHWAWIGDGASINGELRTRSELHSGDVIRLGGTEFLFQTRSTPGTPTAPTSSQTSRAIPLMKL